MDDLRSKALSALFWSFSERAGHQVIQFVIAVILARLLLPEHFGIVALLAVFISIIRIVVDCGLGAALIQREDTDYADECTVFWFNSLMSVFFAIVLSLCSGHIANFFNEPLYRQMVPAISLIFVLGALGNIQVNVLTRKVDFKRQAIINVAALLVSGTCGITMALKGYAAWSLVFQSIIQAAVSTSLMWLLVRWKPSFIFSLASLKKMLPFGINLFMSSIIDSVFNNIYVLIIGKLYSPAQLGFYSKAKNLQAIPVENLYNILGRVAFPIFSRLQSDPVRFKSNLKKSVKLLAFFSFPAMFGLAAVAEPFILLLLTEKWLPAAPFLQLLCMAGTLLPLHAINLNVLKSLGRSDLFLRIEVLKKVLVAVNIFATYKYGVEAMLAGAIVVSILGFYLNTIYTGKLMKYGFFEQMFDIFPTIIISALMGLVVFYAVPIFSENLFVILTFKVMMGGALYMGLSWLFNKRPIQEVLSLRKKPAV